MARRPRRRNERYQATSEINDGRDGEFLTDEEGQLREQIAPKTVKRTRVS